MDARSISTLMDIQTMQTLGSVQSISNGQESSLFSMMINDVLTSITGDSSQTSLLQQQTFGMLESLQSIDSLRYNDPSGVYMPSNLASVINKTVKTYSSDGSDSTHNGHFSSIIKQAAEKYSLPEGLITSVIKQESNFNNSAISGAGASGLMQLMPGTAKLLGVNDSFDPQQNIMGGAKYLRQMLDQFGNVELALAAYNAGPGNVKKYGGIPPFKETQQYVSKVLNYYNRFEI